MFELIHRHKLCKMQHEKQKTNSIWFKNKFKPYECEGNTYHVDVGSIFEIKQEGKFAQNSRGKAYRVVVTEKYYFKDLETNLYYTCPSTYVRQIYDQIGARDGNTQYNGWDFIVWIINDKIRVENQLDYRVPTTKKERETETNITTQKPAANELTVKDLVQDVNVTKQKKIVANQVNYAQNNQTAQPLTKNNASKFPKLSQQEKIRRKHAYFDFYAKGKTKMRCPCCGINYISRDNCYYAHLISQHCGGTNGWDNYVPSCKDCNNDENENNKQCQFEYMYNRGGPGDLSRIEKVLIYTRVQKHSIDKTVSLKGSLVDYAKTHFFGKASDGKIECEEFFEDLQQYLQQKDKINKIKKEINAMKKEQKQLLKSMTKKESLKRDLEEKLTEVDYGRALKKKRFQ